MNRSFQGSIRPRWVFFSLAAGISGATSAAAGKAAAQHTEWLHSTLLYVLMLGVRDMPHEIADI